MIARDRVPDSTAALLRDGYAFATRRFVRYDTDLFETRLLLRRTTCLRGRAAAELFYDTDRFERHGAMPRRGRRTLAGEGGVQGLDGEAHRRRKAMLMSLMRPESVRDLADRFAAICDAAIERWERIDRVVLFDEMAQLLCRAVCDWAGVPLATGEVGHRADQLHALIDAPAALGPRHWRGRLARIRTERWLAALVRQVAHALHQHPGLAARLRDGDDELIEPFVHEVRRYYPFFPVVVARVRRTFDWRGARFPRGRRVLLDLYGTNHHPALWPEPNRFDPERFRGCQRAERSEAFSLVPQGGDGHLTGHRCAGEWITIELMTVALTALTRSVEYDVPDQDLRVSLRRMPATVASGFALRGARRLDGAGRPAHAGRIRRLPSATA